MVLLAVYLIDYDIRPFLVVCLRYPCGTRSYTECTEWSLEVAVESKHVLKCPNQPTLRHQWQRCVCIPIYIYIYIYIYILCNIFYYIYISGDIQRGVSKYIYCIYIYIYTVCVVNTCTCIIRTVHGTHVCAVHVYVVHTYENH